MVINELSSDHFPITFEIPFNVACDQIPKVLNYAKADWKKFRGKVSGNLNLVHDDISFLTPTDIDQNILDLNNIIKKATENSIPLKKKYEFRYQFSHKIQSIIRERNFFRKHSLRYPVLKKEINKLNRLLKKEISSHNQANWNTKMSSLISNL